MALNIRGTGRRPRGILKRGSRGASVIELQHALRRWGYDPGPSDGRFGLLTEDALRQLQKDYALRPDGRAGPEVYGLLYSPRPVPIPRRSGSPLHGAADARRGEASEKDPPSESAMQTGGSAPAGGLTRRGDERLPRWVLVEAAPPELGALGQRTLERYGVQATGIIDRRFASPQPNSDASPALPPELPWPSGVPGWIAWPFPGDVATLGRRLLGRPAPWPGRRRALARVTEAVTWAGRQPGDVVRGFHLLRPAVPWGEGHLWARGVRVLSEALWRHGLTLLVTLAPAHLPRLARRLLGDMHLEEWAPYVEAVIVPAPDIGRPDAFYPWYTRLTATRRPLPPWKMVIGLDLRAVERDRRGCLVQRLSHQQFLTFCYRRRLRPGFDPATGCRRVDYEEDEQTFSLFQWTEPLLSRWVERVELWGFAGIALGPGGTEDERLWKVPLRRLPVARHARPVPGIRFQESEGRVLR